MSGENVEVARGLFPPGRELDGPLIAGHPDMVRDLFEPLIAENFSVTFVAAGLTTTYRGPAAMSEATRDYMDAFSEHCSVFDRHIDGADVVVALGRQHGRAHHGGEFDEETGLVFFFDPNGKLARIQGYQRWREALEAAGLSE
jgi:hypothetical protein